MTRESYAILAPTLKSASNFWIIDFELSHAKTVFCIQWTDHLLQPPWLPKLPVA